METVLAARMRPRWVLCLFVSLALVRLVARSPAAEAVTIDSVRSLFVTDRAVLVTGRGWGHGAGMVQWGAYGKARQGWTAAEIPAFYYGGLRPEAHPEPGLIHVQIASGLTGLRIRSHTGASMDGEPLEPGLVVITGGDRLLVQG